MSYFATVHVVCIFVEREKSKVYYLSIRAIYYSPITYDRVDSNLKLGTCEKVARAAFLFTILVVSIISISFGSQSSNIILATGSISYWPRVDVAINISKVAGINNLQLGFHLDHSTWIGFTDNPIRRELAQEASFKLIRFFDFRSNGPRPCTYWDETTKTGTWNWANVDLFMEKIFEISAEPLICLGGYRSSGSKGLPSGMAVDPATGLPYPESWAVYCAEWVNHFKDVGLSVRFYEIGNEPQAYFAPTGYMNIDYVKLACYKDLFNATAAAMREQNSNLLISFDFSCMKQVITWWLANGGAGLDTLNFHKYDEYRYPYASDEQMLGYAESKFFGPWPLGGYSVTDAQQAYFNARGKLLPIINSESNFNSKYLGGTDPRIPQMVGAVWLALVLRMDIINGVSYNIYYSFSGGGFGMINSADNKPWYPYYVHWMIGRNLGVGDSIVETASSSEAVRTLAWINNQTLNVLLISKVNQPQTVYLDGLQGQLNISKIDNTIPWENPSIQSLLSNSDEPLTIDGYAVMLVQSVT